MSEISRTDIPVNIEDIMHSAYLQYSLSVNVGRAIPDIRDGLKPGNRRILYAMKQLGLSKSHSYTKSAKVVGEVIGNYHPHGDAAIYDTMVRMAQDFAMRSPLVDGQGNFGSIDGDPPAAYRYTECRMERLAEELLADIEKDTVNMLPTFDETTSEPEILPARFPNLLVNGTTGIGVGMATNIPPHNLGEVINATICLMDNPTATIPELMEHLPGPDFPTGATIHGVSGIISFYESGKGVIRLRAKAEQLEKNGKEQLIFTEIPYAVNKENLVHKIAELVKDKKITGIAALRDESSKRTGIRIVVDIKRGAVPDIVLNQLYKHTSLANSIGCTMLVVDGQKPKIINLKQALQGYIDHRLEVIKRRTLYLLNKAERRAHILEGLLIAVKNIDEVVKTIRESRTRDEAGITLQKKFELSETQAKAILDMRLHQLTGLAIEELQSEYDDLMEKIKYYKELLASREKMLGIVKDELIEVRDKYADSRRTEISHSSDDLNLADLIPEHNCVITVSNTAYVKRVPLDTYRVQHRGGKGIVGMGTKDEDFVEHLFHCNSHDLIFFITNRGFLYWLNVYEIPEGSRTGKGKAIVNLIKTEPGEMIRAMLTVKKEDMEKEDLYLVMSTQKGYIKKTSLSAFKNLRRAGIRALKIGDEDNLIDAGISHGSNEIILSSRKGMACHFEESTIRPMGRTARGVTGMRFKYPDDDVVSMQIVEETEETENEEEAALKGGPEIIVISSGGMGKRSYVSNYRKTNRGAKGVRNIRLRDGEEVVATRQVAFGDELIITTQNGIVVRVPVDEVRTVGRASVGVKVMNFKGKDDKVASVAKISSNDIDEEDEEDINKEETETEQKESDVNESSANSAENSDSG